MFTLRPGTPQVRPWPYPFRAGLSLSTDAEFITPEVLDGLGAFLNTRGPTPLGDGLGLEVTFSTFFFSDHPDEVRYFNGSERSAPYAPFASRLDDYLRSGWIDTNHAYGNFDGNGGFTRPHADRVYEVLNTLSVRLPVFTNHGDVHNVQNVAPDAPHHRGDIPSDPAYHADLMAGHGTKYVWTESLVYPRLRLRWLRPLLGRTTYREAREAPVFEMPLRDATVTRGFRRLRGTGDNAPNLSSLGFQLDLAGLDELHQRNRSGAVLYQHLGVLSRHGGVCRTASLDDLRARPAALLGPFRRLARAHDDGRVWVAGLARFLRYVDVVRAVAVEARDGGIELTLPAVFDDDPGQLQGLTLYADVRSEPRLRFRGSEVPLVENGPDETGRYSVSVPQTALPEIW